MYSDGTFLKRSIYYRLDESNLDPPKRVDHLFICAEAGKLCSDKVRTSLQNLTERNYEANLDACIRQLPRGPLMKEICVFFKEIERRKDTKA
ncbi:Protein of unknown function [Cotesia congregata]|uniref:Uncharacterized protein n=1 Tax=Cotesia congregata TaxID=51543 RepID=A0A8J2EIK9_COTCN|nr:Protein of unknown function [Cotesia congregata]